MEEYQNTLIAVYEGKTVLVSRKKEYEYLLGNIKEEV